jgi:hypothetical protein
LIDDLVIRNRANYADAIDLIFSGLLSKATRIG